MKVLCSVRALFLLTIWAGGIGMILGAILIQLAAPPASRAGVGDAVGVTQPVAAADSGGDAPRIEAVSLNASAGMRGRGT
jgi:hypothetical protein